MVKPVQLMVGFSWNAIDGGTGLVSLGFCKSSKVLSQLEGHVDGSVKGIYDISLLVQGLLF